MKRFAIILVVIMLILAGCASDPDVLKMPWDKSSEADIEQTEKPSSDPLPTTDVSQQSDVERLIYVDSENIARLKSLWPLKEYSMNDFGTLSFFSLYLCDYSIMLTTNFESEGSYNDIKAELKNYISGDWEEETGNTSVYGGKAEGISTDCYIYEYSDYVSTNLTFTLEGGLSEVNSFFDAHWPQNGFDMPAELSGKPYSKYFAMTPNMIYFSYDWEVDDNTGLFNSLRDSMAGQSGYKYTPDEDNADEGILFNLGEAEVNIKHSEDLGTVTVTYILYPDDFQLQ